MAVASGLALFSPAHCRALPYALPELSQATVPPRCPPPPRPPTPPLGFHAALGPHAALLDDGVQLMYKPVRAAAVFLLFATWSRRGHNRGYASRTTEVVFDVALRLTLSRPWTFAPPCVLPPYTLSYRRRRRLDCGPLGPR